MASPVRPLLASALLFVALASGASAGPSPPVQIALGESAAAVNKALGPFDVLARFGGPSSNPTETFLAFGLEIELLRGKVETITVRHAAPSLRPDPTHKVNQAVATVERVGAGDAVPILIGETAHAVHMALGGCDVIMLNGALGDETEDYFAAGLSVQYSRNKVSSLTVMRFVLPPKWRHTATAKFKQAVVLVPGS